MDTRFQFAIWCGIDLLIRSFPIDFFKEHPYVQRVRSEE